MNILKTFACICKRVFLNIHKTFAHICKSFESLADVLRIFTKVCEYLQKYGIKFFHNFTWHEWASVEKLLKMKSIS